MNTTNKTAKTLYEVLLADISINKYAVVCDNPQELETATRKLWDKEVKDAKTRRDVADRPADHFSLNKRLTILESITFASAPPADLLQADVLFATLAEFEQAPPQCDILVLTKQISVDRLERIKRGMNEGSR